MEALLEDSTLLQILYNGTDRAVFVVEVSPDGDFRFAGLNPALEKASGFRSEEIIGLTPEELVPKISKEAAKALRARMKACLELSSVYEFREVIPIDSKETHWQTRLTPVRDNAGKISRIVGIAEDISGKEVERISLENEYFRKLEETQKIYRSMAEHVQVVAYRLDSERKPLFLIGNILDLTGYTEEEILSREKGWDELMFREDFDRLAVTHPPESFWEAGFTCNREYRILHKDGSIRWVNDYSAVLTDQEGNVKYIQGALTDTTQWKEVEKAIIESEERYRSLFENAKDMIHIVDKQGNLTHVNRTELATLGYKEEEMVGRKLLDFIHPGHRKTSRKAFESVARGQIVDRFETVLVCKSGRKIIAEVSMVPEIRDGKFVSSHAILRDLTDLRKISSELEETNKELIEKNRELEQIVYVTSHDLRSPLVNIQGFNQELEMSIGELVKLLNELDLQDGMADEFELLTKHEIPEALEYIKSGIRKMDTLLKGLLTISRLGRRPLESKRINMHAMMVEVIRAFQFQLNESGMQVELDEQLPDCRGDESQINQAFSNLVDNAIKYRDTSRKGVMSITAAHRSGHLLYTVKDNGIGIAESKHEKIFEIFHKHEPGISGEGLGLTIVRKIIERHHGRISVESEPGKGSSFTISLPDLKGN